MKSLTELLIMIGKKYTLVQNIIFTFLICVSYSAISQETGPGGVGTSTNNVLWLDAEQLGLTDGDPVSTWGDVSGNGHDASQGVASNQPAYVASSSFNSKPSVKFDGNDSIATSAISELNTDEITWFVVAKSNSSSISSGKGLIKANYSSQYDMWGSQHRRVNASQSEFFSYSRVSGGVTPASYYKPSNNSTEHLLPFIVGGRWSAANEVNTNISGTAATTATGRSEIPSGNSGVVLGFRKVSGSFLEGEVAEAIVFDEDLNDAAYIIVSNYLAGKYDITLSGGMSRYDYGSTHSYEIAGIGREDASNEHLSAQGTGIVSMTSAGLDDGDYIMWGHDNAGTTTSTTNTPAAYAVTNGNRLDQEWIVTETGEVGTVSITIDLTGIEFGFEDEYELLVNDDGDGDFSDASRYTGTPAGSILTFSLDAAELNDGARFTCGNTQKTVISVQDGQNWNVSSTWSCSCIPTNQNNAIVDDGHTVTVNDGESINDLIINATGELVIDNGGDFEITGDVDSDGDFSVTQASKITLNGAAAQTLDFTGTVAFDTLEVNNSAGVDFNTGTFTFSGALLPTDGDLSFGANSVTFLSSASGTASIGPQGDITQVITMTNVTSQRFIAAGSAGWREVGFPFNADYKLSDWDDEVFISGPAFPDGCAYNADGCFTSVKYWGGVRMQGITSVDSIINAGTGVDFYLGDNLNTFSAHTLQTTKSLNLTFEQIIPLTSDWNFIANPFLSPIDFDNITLNGADNYFWVYDPATDGWQFYEPGGSPETFSANLAGGIISAYQGFWVFNPGGVSPEIVIDQSAKSVSSGDAFLKTSQLLKSNCFTMEISDKLGESTSSRLFLDFKGNRPNVPMLPRLHDELRISLEYEGNDYTMLSSLIEEECIRLPLTIEGVEEEGYYDFKFSNIPDHADVILMNTKNGYSQVIDRDVNVELFVAEKFKDAYVLMVKSKTGMCEWFDDVELSYTYSGGTILVSGLVNDNNNFVLSVYDLSGKLVSRDFSVVQNNQLQTTEKLHDGYYLVEVSTVDGKKVDTGKIVVTK